MTNGSVAATGRVRVATVLATLGGLGYAPAAPGTAASAVVAGLYLLLPLDLSLQVAIVLLVTALAIWSSRVVAAARGEHDPTQVVIDEAAGMLIACLMLPKTPLLLLAAFLIFRALDVAKWFPIRQTERLPGGLGIVADDVVAGLFTRGVIWLWPF